MASLKKNNVIYSYWICFFILTISNSLLSFSNFSLQVKGWIFTTGIILPTCLWIFAKNSGKEKYEIDYSPNSKESYDSIPHYLIFWPVFLLSVLVRIYFYLSPGRWPGGDEVLNGFLAIDLAQKWKWDFFYTCGQLPPLLTWALSCLFKHPVSYCWSLWFIPLLVSSLTVLVSYWAFRPLFKAGPSLVFACLMALSFWPVYQGGFCHQGILIPLWESCVFFVFGRLRYSQKEKKGWLALVLGLTTGMGSFTFTSWPVVALGVFIVFFFISEGPPKSGLQQKLFFIIGFLLAVVPFCLAVLKNGYGAHILGSSPLIQRYGLDHQWVTRIGYLSAIFWGPLQSGTSYGPIWGGMLNPLLGSFFWIGLAEVFQRGKNFIWIALILTLTLLPGLLSADYVEMFRIVQAMPLVLFIVTIGFLPVFRWVQGKKRAVILGLIFCFSFGLDFHHLSLAFQSSQSGNGRQFTKILPDQNFNAFRILKRTSEQSGLGIIFTDFLPLSYGHFLGTTTYSFNALANPGLTDSSVGWAGILADIDYQPFLSREFPQAKWYWATTKIDSADRLMVGITTLNAENRGTFRDWARAHQFFHQLSVESESDFYSPTIYRQSLQKIDSGYSLVGKDRFLESCYGEWVAQYYFNPSYSENIMALQRAIRNGYPAAHLYQRLSDILAGQGLLAESEKVHRKALQTTPRFQLGPDFEIEGSKFSK